MTSSTMRVRSIFCEGVVSGSVSCDGGGQTLSWNIEPDSDARGRNKRGGEVDKEGDCVREDCE
jgi:hypothetical protein